MTLDEMLKLADDLVFAKTGQHLKDLQEKIVRGTIQGETYEKIAEDFHCNESYVRDIGAKLWHIFSELLGEEVNKSNLRSVMQRLQISLFSNVVQDHVQVGNINFCEKIRQPPDIPNSNFYFQETPTPHHELSEMPELGVFYNRTSELETLKTWILQEHCRLITITGISGIGKTQLAVKLLQEIKQDFEYILWYNLDNYSTFPEFQAELFQLFEQQTE
ncbi:MAG: ATPase, partial [Planktothrix sp.]